MQYVSIWALIAVAVGLIAFVFYKLKKLKLGSLIALPLLAFYLSFVFTITLFERIPTSLARYELNLFWTYEAILAGRSDLKAEIFWNVVLFIPIGFLILFLLTKKLRWLGIVIGLLISAGIEVCQLVFHRGLFEFDDIIHNTLGTVIGIGIFMLTRWLLKLVTAKHRTLC